MTEVVEDTMNCLTVAASSAITDYADVLVRGYLKDHPDQVTYRLDLLAHMIGEVRAVAERELASGGWEGTIPFSPGDDHHEQVAEFVAHTCDCDWCLHAVAGEIKDAWPS